LGGEEGTLEGSEEEEQKRRRKDELLNLSP